MTQDKQEPIGTTVDVQWQDRQPTLEERLRARERDYSQLPGVDTLPYRGERFETQDPQSFREWRGRERDELRGQALDLLQGRPVDGVELLGNVFTNVLGSAMRSNDGSRERMPGDHHRDREDGVIRDRHGYRVPNR